MCTKEAEVGAASVEKVLQLKEKAASKSLAEIQIRNTKLQANNKQLQVDNAKHKDKKKDEDSEDEEVQLKMSSPLCACMTIVSACTIEKLSFRLPSASLFQTAVSDRSLSSHKAFLLA